MSGRRLKVRIIPLEGYGTAPFTLTFRAVQIVIRLNTWDAGATIDGGTITDHWGTTGGPYVFLEFRPQNDKDGSPLEYDIDWNINPGVTPILGAITIVYLEDH